jgi:hypothetical protein
LSLAIDKILLENPINKMNPREKEKLVKLYIKRAQCYMQMAEKYGKISYANLCADDCSFIANENNLDKRLIMLELGVLHQRSGEFIKRHQESERVRENRRQRQGQVLKTTQKN